MRKSATEQAASSADISASEKPEPNQYASHRFCRLSRARVREAVEHGLGLLEKVVEDGAHA